MEVEIWRVSLGGNSTMADIEAADLDCLRTQGIDLRTAPSDFVGNGSKILTNAENQRARRARSAEVARRFVTARAALRWILGRELGLDPKQLEFVAEKGAKPKLADPHGGLHFNLTHSNDFALVALSRSREVGVDLEWHDSRVDVAQLAKRFFATEEQPYLELSRTGGTDRVLREFFRLWTLREAYLKGLGLGLSVPLDGFAISGPDEDPPRLLRTDHGDTGAWGLRSFLPFEGYSGAVAVQAPNTAAWSSAVP